jgi:hypothetical protein
MNRQLGLAACFLGVATVIWLIAFLTYDRVAQHDAWHAYNHWCAPILWGSIFGLASASGIAICRLGLLPGRPVSAIIIGLFVALYI